MAVKSISFYISVSCLDADNEDIEKLTRELNEELNELDYIESIEVVQTGTLPKGAKGVSIDVGTLLIKMAEFGGISALITILGTWLGRDKSRVLKLQIGDKSLELTGLSKIEQQELIHWFQAQTNLRLDR